MINGLMYTDRSIKDNTTIKQGEYMSDKIKEWWKDLGKELEVDIETLEN